MKNKMFYLLFIPYLISFILLVFHYSHTNDVLANNIMTIKKDLNLSTWSLNILITFISLLFSTLTFLIYYGALKSLLKKVNGNSIDEEHLAASILISESCCHVVALTLVGIIQEDILRMLIPLVGLLLLGTILHQKYSIKLVSISVLVRSLFYVSNALTVILEFTG